MDAMDNGTHDGVWPALLHAQMLAHAAIVYRGSQPRVEEALELLRINDYRELLRAKSKYMKTGQLTWARVAGAAVDALAKDLLRGDVERALDAAEDARELAERLRERDRDPSARVTAQLRSRIGQLVGVGKCIEGAVAMRDGAAPDFDSLGLLLSLRTRWYALRREHASELDADWVRALAQQASGKVLSHADASQGLKAMATRAVSAWTPQDEEAPSRVSPSDSSDRQYDAGSSAEERPTHCVAHAGQRWTRACDPINVASLYKSAVLGRLVHRRFGVVRTELGSAPRVFAEARESFPEARAIVLSQPHRLTVA